MASIGRGLYVERLTAGSTTAARKCLLITRKIIIHPPDSGDPLDGPPYLAKKMFPPVCWDPPITSSHARKCVRKKTIRPPDCWDPPATLSHARKLPDSQDPPGRSIRSIVILVANVYVHTSHCRGAHVACTHTYSGEGARKKIRPRTYIRAGSLTPIAHTYMAGSKRRNNVVVVFMGRQRNASCSSGGNRMRGSQPAVSERNAWLCSSGGLGRNRRWK